MIPKVMPCPIPRAVHRLERAAAIARTVQRTSETTLADDEHVHDDSLLAATWREESTPQFELLCMIGTMFMRILLLPASLFY